MTLRQSYNAVMRRKAAAAGVQHPGGVINADAGLEGLAVHVGDASDEVLRRLWSGTDVDLTELRALITIAFQVTCARLAAGETLADVIADEIADAVLIGVLYGQAHAQAAAA